MIRRLRNVSAKPVRLESPDSLPQPGDPVDSVATTRAAEIEARPERESLERRTPLTRFKPDGVFRFQAEAELLSQIDCPWFLQPLSWGISDNEVFILRRKVDAQSLQQLLSGGCDARDARHRALFTWPDALQIAHCVLEALQRIHQARCIHRHVRPSTVWIDGARGFLECPPPEAYQEATAATTLDLLEFAQFASPELSGSIEHDIGPASDLYSVGVLLYAMLAGQPPFRGDTVGAVLFQHIATEPNWDELGNEPPLVVVELLARLLRKEPRDRYQSAAGVLADIEQILACWRDGKPVEWFVIGRCDRRESVVGPAFVGRTEELRQLNLSLDRVASGAGESIAITCPSGIGKSRTVLEVIRTAVRRGFLVYRGIASDDAGQQPAAPLIQLVNQLTARVAKDAKLRAAIQRATADIHRDVAALFPDLAAALGWHVTTDGDDELGATRIQHAFVRLLTNLASAEQPVLVWLDDCQWLDAQSLAIIEGLNQRTAPRTLFLYSMRDAEGTTEAFLERVRIDRRIPLQPLTSDEIRAMVESMTGPLPDEAIATVVRLAVGSPFMASAVVYGMVESGALVATADGWQVQPEKMATLHASTSAAQVLLHRLEQLPTGLLQQLTAAAIIGKEFAERTVAALSKLSHQQSKDQLELARSQRLIWTMPDGRWAFVHDKIREALLDRLSPDERREHHNRYANFLEDSGDDSPFELAYHFHAAGAIDRALPYALQAADSARRLHSLDRAEELLHIAWKGRAFVDPSTQLEIGIGLAEVLMLAGKYDKAEHWFENAQQLVATSYDLARLNAKRGELAFKRGDKEKAVQLFQQALYELRQSVPTTHGQLAWQLGRELFVQLLHSLFPRWFVARRRQIPHEAERLTWRLFSRLAHGFWYTKGKFYTLWAHLRGLNLAERYPPTPELAQAYSEHAPAMSLIPWHRRGIQYAQRSLRMRQEFNDLWGQGQSRNFYSILLYSSSQFEQCIDQATQAESILVRTGDFWEVHIARYQLAASLYRQGKLKEALDAAQRTYEMALAIGDYQSTGNIIDVWVRAALGQIPAEILAQEKVRTLRDRQGECQSLLAEGIFLYFRHDFIAAIECFRRAIRIAERAGVFNAFITPNYAWLATALRQEFLLHPPKTRRARKRALNQIRRAAKRAVRVGRWFQNDLPHALREYGCACSLFGWPRRARQYLRYSAVIARQQGAEYELALTEKMYGEIGQEYGWSDADSIGQRGRAKVREFRQLVRRDESRQESISLIDRFDTLLSAGREIVSAHTRTEIFARTLEAAKRLLRGQKTLILEPSANHPACAWRSFDTGQTIGDTRLLELMLRRGRTAVADRELATHDAQPLERHGSFLMAPITLRGKIVACLHVAHDSLTNLWGPNEIRIADYLVTSAGAALEKAETFQALEQLNIQLEEKVLERTAAVEARSKQLELTAQELLATQDKLKQARDEAESANAAKSQFLARMSHEIRTPISAIIGFTEVLLRNIVKDPREARRKLQTIHANGTHLLQLINDLLDLSKIEANKMEMEAIDCCPVRILHEVVASLQVRAEEKGIALKMQFEGKVPMRITSDPTRLRQILTNIIGNAIKFTAQGYVSATMRLVQPPQAPTPLVEFEITDTGIGMTPAQMSRIFDPFTQADNSVARRFGGTGLGLTISRQLAEALGGGISLSSELGMGSTFTVRVSAGALDPTDLVDGKTAHDFVADDMETSQIEINLANVRVLIVDDTETNRELLALILKETGANVELAEDGQQAVDWLAQHAADVVLMDMQMPVMDGYEAVRQLRERGFDKPIIALTANSMQGDEAKCRDAGCSDYLSKPIDINLLLRKLAKWTSIDVEPSPMEAAGTCHSICPIEPINGLAHFETTWQDELPSQQPYREFALELVEKVTKQFDLIVDAVNQQDWTELAKKAHWMKGTGGTVGLHGLSDVAGKLESAALDRDTTRLRSTVTQLQQYLQLKQ